jgi:soluble lytic murein transglycosylase-like protein
MIMPNLAKQFSWLRLRREADDSLIVAKTIADLRSFDPGLALVRRCKASRRTSAVAAGQLIFVRMAARLFAITAAGFFSFPGIVQAGKTTPNTQTAASSSWASLIAEASQRFGVPERCIRAVMRVESAGDQGALSPKGAIGLMQIMP